MTPRPGSRRWLALLALAGCLNPQPDTTPLATPAEDVTAPAPDRSGTGSSDPTNGPPISEEEAVPNPPAATPSEPLGGGFGGNAADADAGVPPPDGGAGDVPSVVTFGASDAGTLDPGAQSPPAADD